MTMNSNPKLAVNRFPWNLPTATARMHLETFLAAARRRIDAQPASLPFDPAQGHRVLAWLTALLDRPPHRIDQP